MDRATIKEIFTPNFTKLVHLFVVELETCKYLLDSQRDQVSCLFISTIGHIHSLDTLLGAFVQNVVRVKYIIIQIQASSCLY